MSSRWFLPLSHHATGVDIHAPQLRSQLFPHRCNRSAYGSKTRVVILGCSKLFSGLGIVFYDYVVTFPNEIQCIWRRKLNVATSLLLVIRYTTLLGVSLWATFSLTSAISATPKEGSADLVRFLSRLPLNGSLTFQLGIKVSVSVICSYYIQQSHQELSRCKAIWRTSISTTLLIGLATGGTL